DKFNKLIKVYNLALKKNPQDVEAYVQKARLFMAMSPMGEDNYDEAYLRETVDLLVRAQSIKKEYNQEIYTLLFHAHLNLKNFDLANGYYRVLCAESKSPFLEHSFGADLEEARGNFAAAEKHILELSTFKVQSNESFPFYEPQMARIYLKSKKYDFAEKLYLKFNSVNAAGIDSAKFLSHIYFEQKDYDKIVTLDKKQTEMRSANRVPTSMLSEAHYFRILKKYGLTQASDGTISAEELKKVSAMPTLIEKDLAEIAQIDVANTKPLQLLIKLNSYLYQTKQQPVFSSKVDYYTTLLNKIRQSGGDAQRDVSSVSKETAPSN
ncbi:MAG: hypothetical protein K2P92_01635, partial [Bdellovibrionaceae bacterium]|nr:hypothetical protein [Pseudobdellovibrionaceae bacterium]